jgi:hypothetical protein
MVTLKRALLAVPAALVLLYAVALASCTSLPRHTAAPYDEDAEQAAKLEDAAKQWCADHEHPAGEPTVPFRFDGCSWWFDGDPADFTNYRDCCQTHDYAYWCGGSEGQREDADDALRSCVARKRGSAYARLMWLGVRAGGHPAVPLYFRWGYGHPYAGRYPKASATAAER